MPDPEDPRPEDAATPQERTDAAGFDVTAPPGTRDIGHRNPGLSDDMPPDREGWREFDATAEWEGDAPYPDPDQPNAEPEEEAEEEPPTDLAGAAGPGDLLDRVVAVLEGDDTLLIDDLSVETRGSVVVLRGIAGSAEDRQRAGNLASAVPGVDRVDNQLGADAAGPD